MIRRDFVKRLSALAALPILPAFLRREPVYLGNTDALIAHEDYGPYGAFEDGDWHRVTYPCPSPAWEFKVEQMWWTTPTAKGAVTRRYERDGNDWRLVSVRHG